MMRQFAQIMLLTGTLLVGLVPLARAEQPPVSTGIGRPGHRSGYQDRHGHAADRGWRSVSQVEVHSWASWQ